MTLEEAKEALVAAGFKEYPPPFKDPCVCMSRRFHIEVPKCLTNDREPEVHVKIWHSLKIDAERTVDPSMEVEVVGESPGGWTSLKFYGISLEDPVLSARSCGQKLLEAWSTMWK